MNEINTEKKHLNIPKKLDHKFYLTLILHQFRNCYNKVNILATYSEQVKPNHTCDMLVSFFSTKAKQTIISVTISSKHTLGLSADLVIVNLILRCYFINKIYFQYYHCQQLKFPEVLTLVAT